MDLQPCVVSIVEHQLRTWKRGRFDWRHMGSMAEVSPTFSHMVERCNNCVNGSQLFSSRPTYSQFFWVVVDMRFTCDFHEWYICNFLWSCFLKLFVLNDLNSLYAGFNDHEYFLKSLYKFWSMFIDVFSFSCEFNTFFRLLNFARFYLYFIFTNLKSAHQLQNCATHLFKIILQH